MSDRSAPATWQEINFSSDEATRWKQAKEFAVGCVPHFHGAEPDDLEVSILSGGITNQLLRVRRHSTGRSVVVRIFGAETNRIISRESELFWQQRCLETYGKCANGLVYEYLDNHVPLSPPECRQHIRQIAVELAAFHRGAAAASLHRVPYATQRLYVDVVLKNWPEQGTCTEAVEKIRRNDKGRVALEAYGDLAEFRAAAGRVASLLARAQAHLPVVPCHNDLLAYNIMVNEETHRVRFIDFEYARRNLYLYDIANHLVEWAGFECTWADLPSAAEDEVFIVAYLGEALKDGVTEAERAAATAAAMALLPICKVAAHFAWSAWSLIQGAYSEIDFDYVAYGATKYKRALEEFPAASKAADAFLESAAAATSDV